MAMVTVSTNRGEVVDVIGVEADLDLSSPVALAVLVAEIVEALKLARRIEGDGH